MTLITCAASSARAFREHIVEYRRMGEYEKSVARELWNTVTTFLQNDREPEWLLDRTSQILPDGWEMLRYDYDPQLRGFAGRVWPRIVTAIREQLESEKASA